MGREEVLVRGLPGTEGAGLLSKFPQGIKQRLPVLASDQVNAQEPFHSGNEIGLRGLDHEMKMVAHQAPGMDLPFGLGAGFAKGAQEELAIVIVFEDVAALVSTIDHVVNSTGIFNAQFAWHGPEHALNRELCQ